MAFCGACGNRVDAAFCSLCGHPNPAGHPLGQSVGDAPGGFPGESTSEAATQLRPALPDLAAAPAPPPWGRPAPTLPPQWLPSASAQPVPMPSAPTAPTRGRPPWLLPLLSSVLVLAVAVGYAVWSSRGTAPVGPGVSSGAAGAVTGGLTSPGSAPSAAPAGTTATPSASVAPSPSVVTASPSTQGDPRRVAYDRLESLVLEDAGKNVVRGQWVAQLASKHEGIVDPLVRIQPYSVPEILAEHEALRVDPVFGASVRLLHQGDWGRSPPHDPPMWVTVADLDAGSAAAVRAWCQARFAQRGKALDNVCYARQLTPKGS